MINRANAAEVVRRTSAIYGMLLEGQTRAAIVQYAADQWQVSARTADAYIARCRDDLRLHLGLKNAYALGLALKGLTGRYTPIAQYTEHPICSPRPRAKKAESHLKPNSDTARRAAPANGKTKSAYTDNRPVSELPDFADEDEAAAHLLRDID